MTTLPTATGRYDVLVTTDTGTHVVGPFSKEERATIAAKRLQDYAAEGGLTLTTQVLPLEGAFAPEQALIFLDAAVPGARAQVEAARQAAKDEAAKAAKPAATPAPEAAPTDAHAADLKDAGFPEMAKRAERNAKRVDEPAVPETLVKATSKPLDEPSPVEGAELKDSPQNPPLKPSAPKTEIEGVKADKPKPRKSAAKKAA